MILLDQLVDQALSNQPKLNALRPVVEKELLQHDILRLLNQHRFLEGLTFIGGTCLRSCYGAVRLSEDLDFTGGADFSRDTLSEMGALLVRGLTEKYGLKISVTDPVKEDGNVDTWKVKVETKPEQKHLPSQRINIDVCAVPSYDRRLKMLLNPYNVDMGTSGLFLYAVSQEELFADKLIAFAFRPNRIKFRDLWDILWLHQQGISPSFALIPKKLKDRRIASEKFLKAFHERQQVLVEDAALSQEFKQEMLRFLPAAQINSLVTQATFWPGITHLIGDLSKLLRKKL